jgi:hypothetical protein
MNNTKTIANPPPHPQVIYLPSLQFFLNCYITKPVPNIITKRINRTNTIAKFMPNPPKPQHG